MLNIFDWLPDSKRRTGIKIIKIICPLSVSIMLVDCPIVPRLSRAYPKNMPKINSIGVYGILVFLLISRRIPPIRSPKATNRTTKGPE